MVEPNNTTVSDNTENGAHNMVKLTIDNCEVVVPEHTTILDAAKSVSIQIPTLCYLRDLNEIGGCRVCVVEVEGCDQLVAACNNYVLDGMVVHTNSPKAREARRINVELILSQHDCKCATCVRSGNCNLQTIANDLGIFYLPYQRHLAGEGWDFDFPIIRENDKCIKCMRCIKVCESVQGLGIWDLTNRATHTAVGTRGRAPIGKTDCVACGQCITHCPTGALRERDDTETVFDALANPDKIVLVQIAPAVRSAWGEELGLADEDAPVGKIFDALKRMGVDYAFDTVFSADLTIMEESTEFIKRFTSGELKERPMFTSCCPGWVRFVKTQFPYMVNYLSTAKSPQQMFGAVMKTYFAEKLGVSPDQIFTLSIMPCVAKKGEREMDLFYGEYAGHDVDAVLTTRELVKMIRSAHIRPDTLVEIPGDSPMHGAGVIFGATGGVMEAALRTAYFTLKGENPPADAFKAVRSGGFQENAGVQEAEFTIGDIKLRIAAVSGLGNTRRLLQQIERGEVHYDFVEVMACPGGCVGGGGQPIHDGEELAFARGRKLYALDAKAKLRYSHENPDIREIYSDFFGKPMSHKAHMLLHTEHWKNN